MLYISYRLPSVGGVRNPKNIEWHVGDPTPSVLANQRVVTFQADGHELDVILKALERTREPQQ